MTTELMSIKLSSLVYQCCSDLCRQRCSSHIQFLTEHCWMWPFLFLSFFKITVYFCILCCANIVPVLLCCSQCPPVCRWKKVFRCTRNTAGWQRSSTRSSMRSLCLRIASESPWIIEARDKLFHMHSNIIKNKMGWCVWLCPPWNN